MNTLLALALVVTGTLNIDGVDHDINISPSTVVEQPAPPTAPPPPPVTPPPVVDTGFCNAPGVVLCETFDTPEDVAKGSYTRNYEPPRVRWEDGALHFDAPAGSVADTSGNWTASMSEPFGPGQVMTLEFKLKLSELWADASIGGHGPKVLLMYQRGEKTCGWSELAFAFSRYDYKKYGVGYPLTAYTECGAAGNSSGAFYPELLLPPEQRGLLYDFWQTGDGPVEEAIANAVAVKDAAWLQNAVNPEAEKWCSYHLMKTLEARQGRSCLRGIPPETWTQVKVRVTRYTNDLHPDPTLKKRAAADRRNKFEMWWAPVGQPLELISRVEWFYLMGAQTEIMVTPYRTKAAGLIGDHWMKFDDLRVTLEPLG